MALTPSNMMPLGTVAPDFNLLDVVSGEMQSLQSLKSEVATVVMFICNHCPYVKHIKTPLTEMATRYQEQGVRFIAINSNDVNNYPEDSPEKMKADAQAFAYPFPYLFDETQEVAKAYDAACTPDFYIFDAQLQCVYRGQLDDSRPGNDIPVSGKDLCGALDQLLAGQPISDHQKASVGCNIKWRAV